MFGKVLIANRGEIAVRVARTLRDLGVGSVAVFSDADRGALHARVADEAVHIPGVAPADTYANTEAILEAAHARGAQAIHPGYGFLAESADFAAAVVAAGLVWIGPPPEATRLLGDKIRARELARSVGVPVVPGLFHPIASPDEVAGFAGEHGFPVALKAAAGGGGRGFRVVRTEAEIAGALTAARREAQAYFGASDVYVERYLDAPKHLEVQILAPSPDEALWLGVRDCSLQRRHQKLVEETPPPLDAPLTDMGHAALALAKASGYVNAGTVEMLSEAGAGFGFLEVNARLQVEHTVTEEVLGIDLVACQLRIAAGEPLGFAQDDIVARGHALECRINAEDPARGFAPAPGRIRSLVAPSGPGVRVDEGYASGDEVPGAYDSLVVKVVTRGATREEARTRMLRALDEMVVDGISTTIEAQRALLESEAFRAGAHTTATVAAEFRLDEPDEPAAGAAGPALGGRLARLWHPAMAGAAVAATAEAAEVVAPLQGTVVEVLVEVGAQVDPGAPVAVLEAMKMETVVTASIAGEIAAVDVATGAVVEAGRLLARIRPAPDARA